MGIFDKLRRKKNGGDGNEEPARLCELAVKWVLLNPEPIALGETTYRR